MLYLIVTIVVYLGVNQVLLLWHDSVWLEKWDLVSKWWINTVSVDANEKSENWSEKELYIRVIDEYLSRHNSPMAGNGEVFIENAKKYNLPRYLMVAIAGVESNFGVAGYASTGTYNAVGLGVHEGRKYKNWGEGIEDMAYVLRNYYFDEGKDETVEIQNKWAPRCTDSNSCDNSWADSVNYFINDLNNLEKEKKGEI
jgi:beta-N-acetylglucosaminidase